MTAARVLLADPPWSFGDNLPGKTRGAARQYACLDLDAIKAFPLPPLAEDAVLFLWRVSAMQREALIVARAWGFEVKSEIVWLKRTVTGARHFGMGRFVRAGHETCLIATRGRCLPLVRNVRSTFEAPVGRHSEKPERFYEIVEAMYEGPRVELFARRRRAGWRQFGDQLPGQAVSA